MGLSLPEIQSLLLIDLLPHDIYVKSGDGYEVIIPKGCSIPAKKTIEFEVEEGQEDLMVEVYRKKEGEDYTVSMNRKLSIEIGRVWIPVE